MSEKRILIVEDDSDWRENILRRSLEKSGEEYVVVTAATYEEALGWLEQGQFTLVTMDISLVDSKLSKPGLDLADYIANFCESTKIIVVSGSEMSMKEMRDLFKECEIFDFFEKTGFSRRKFIESVKKAVESSAGADVEVAIEKPTFSREPGRDDLGIEKIKILVVFANPRGSDPLRLGEEDRIIRECIERSTNRDHLYYLIRHAVRVKDVQRALLEDRYQIVQFSGHATPSGNLAFEDEIGNLKPVPQQALASFLSNFDSIECVILNACYSLSQGQLISMGVPFTIAMDGPISDDAAKHFARGFYDAIGAGKDYRLAYRIGCNAIAMEGYPEERTPQFLETQPTQ